MTRAAPAGWTPVSPQRIEEDARLVGVGRRQLYVVAHRPCPPARARALLCGPFGIERTFAYTTWMRLARALAVAGFEAVTFDYHGTGESEGSHRDVTFGGNVDDASRLAGRFDDDLPLVLLGLRWGGLVAAKAFSQGVGDGLLLLDPAGGVQVHLREVLRRKLAEDFAQKGKGGHKPSREAYLQKLREEGELEVEGFEWSLALFDQDQSLVLPDEDDPRPVRVIHLDKRPDSRVLLPGKSGVWPVPRPPFWGSDPLLLPALGGLFDACVEFVSTVAAPKRGNDA